VTCAFRHAIVLIAVTSIAQFSAAANYTVTTGSGSGTNSLAWAINSANAAGAGPHTITVSPSVTTISVSASLPIINANVSIEGHGTTIVGNNQQLFVVNSGTVSLRDMNVTGGRALGGTGGVGNGGGGGGLGWGGGLFVNAGARVTIENVTFDSNRAQGGAGGGTSSAEGGGGGGGFRHAVDAVENDLPRGVIAVELPRRLWQPAICMVGAYLVSAPWRDSTVERREPFDVRQRRSNLSADVITSPNDSLGTDLVSDTRMPCPWSARGVRTEGLGS
jgi:hypothetical protein